MIKFVVFNMDAGLTWPYRQRDNDYSEAGRHFDTFRYRVGEMATITVNDNDYDSERTLF